MTDLAPPYSLPGPSLLNRIIQGSRVGHGATVVEGAIQSRNFSSGSTGWQLTAEGNLEANSGNFRGDITGATGTFSSSISVGSGFNVDSSGNVWWGAAGSYAAATNKISSTGSIDFNAGQINIGSGAFTVTTGGAVTASNITVTGGSLDVTALSGTIDAANLNADSISGLALDIGGNDATSWHVNSTGQMWSGAATYASAPFRVDNSGDVVATNITATGTITAQSGSSLPGTYFASGTIPSGVGINLANNAGTYFRSNNYSAGSAGWEIDGQGNAEFNSVQVRGEFETATSGNRISIGSSGSTLMEFTNAGARIESDSSYLDLIAGTTTATGSHLRLGNSSGSGYIRLQSRNGGTIDIDSDNILNLDSDGNMVFNSSGGSILIQGDVDVQIESASAANIATFSTTAIDFNERLDMNGFDIDLQGGDLNGTAMIIDDSGVLTLDGSTRVDIDNDGAAVASFQYGSSIGLLEIYTNSATEGGEIMLDHGNSGSRELHIDNWYSGSQDQMRILGNSTVIAKFDLTQLLYDKTSSGGRDVEVTSSGMFYVLSSSRDTKDLIQPLPSGNLPNLRALDAVSFVSRDEFDGSGRGARQIGFIAEDLAPVYPEVVHYDQDETGEYTVPVGVDYKRMSAVLWKMCQELLDRVERLESRV